MSEPGGPSELETARPRPAKRWFGASDPPEPWFTFLGFVVVTRADLLAAAAFLLSVTTLVFQLSSWLSGPEPSVYPPDIVYVRFDPYANNRTVLRFAAQMSLVNTAGGKHDVIVRDIRLEATAPGLKVLQDWLSFTTVQRSGTQLLVPPTEAAHPFPVAAGGAASYTVSFAPTEQACGDAPAAACDPDRDFMDEAQFLNAIAGAKTMTLTFSVRLVGRAHPLTATCSLPTGAAFRQYIAENGWFAARCYSAT